MTATAEHLNEFITLYEGDCLDVLPTLGKVGAVVTDPPYGVSLKSHGTWFRAMRPIEGDETQEIGQTVVDWCQKLGLPLLAFCDPLKQWRGDWRQSLVWDKGGAVGIGGDRATCFKRSWEMLLACRNFGPLNGNRDEAVLRFCTLPGESQIHPATKPIPLMRYLVRKFTQQGSIVLDPFAGSGTTGIAAMKEGRRCILIEKDPEYCDIIRRRVREADGVGEGSLFAFAGRETQMTMGWK